MRCARGELGTAGVRSAPLRAVRDPHDQVFLDLALAAATPVLVTGDSDLLAAR